MDKVKCVAIDDDPLFLDIIKFYARKIEYLDLLATYENPIEGALGLVKLKPDLLFLDVEMPYLDGFEAVSTLEVVPKIIVISSHNPLEIDSFGFDVAKFIQKPLKGIDDFDKTIREVLDIS